jgi:ElaB/YqjD/DUF883 family membrane-anchored ribosome-binding protein
MEMTYWEDNKTAETLTDSQYADSSGGFENVKTVIADKILKVAEVLGDKARDKKDQSGMAQYGKQASEWLEQSAEYVRQFEYEDADARVREYVRQRPGRSLLIAGGIGLMIGAMFRRR